MAKTATATVTATRSLADIVEDFASISDSGALRYQQARLTYEFIGSTEGKEAAELKERFRKEANEALRRHHEAELSVPGVTNLVNTWKYMLRANVDTSPENPQVNDVAKAAFNFASQSFRKKEENYVIPAIEAIVNGADPVSVFVKETARLKADKKKDAEDKNSARPNDGTSIDDGITFDVIVSVLQVIPTIEDLTAEQKATLRDLLANAGASVAE